MIAEITGLLTAAGHVTNVAKTLVDAHDRVERDAVRLEMNEALVGLQGKIAEEQAAYSQLLESNEALKQKLKAYERWEQESARYELKEIASGILAYALKPSHASGEPSHWLCAACYNERKKSILQLECKGSDVLICPFEHPPLITGERGP